MGMFNFNFSLFGQQNNFNGGQSFGHRGLLDCFGSLASLAPPHCGPYHPFASCHATLCRDAWAFEQSGFGPPCPCRHDVLGCARGIDADTALGMAFVAALFC